jgi:hypothetical protein
LNESIIKDIGRSFIVSSLLPAMLFVLLAVAFFRNFVPVFLVENLRAGGSSPVYGAGALLLTLVSWVAFILYSGVDYIVKFFEGYYFPGLLALVLKWFQYTNQKRQLSHFREYVRSNQEQVEPESQNHKIALADWLQKLLPFVHKGPELDDLQLYTQAGMELQPGELTGPLDDNWRKFMPTRLGNILLASERYPYERYSIDGITIFPRMSVLFPPEFQAKLEEKNNHLVFLLNSSLLSIVLGYVALVLGIVGTYILTPIAFLPPETARDFLQRGFSQISPQEYLWLGSGLLLVGYFIYGISINVAIEYGICVRTGFDLYRFKLLMELNRSIPESLKEEQGVWLELSDFFKAGQRMGEIGFTYKLKAEYAEFMGNKKIRSARSRRKPTR